MKADKSLIWGVKCKNYKTSIDMVLIRGTI